MTFGQRLGLNISPLLLRIGLAFVFIYYGAAKLFYADMPVQGDAAAYLANAGFINPLISPGKPMPEEAPKPAAEPGAEKGSGKAVLLDHPAPGYVVILAQNTEKPENEAPKTETPPAEKSPKAEQPPPTEEATPATAEKKAEAGTSSASKYTASDFPNPMKVRRLLGLVLTMHNAAEHGHWPSQLSSPAVLRALAWVACLTEFLGGWLLLLGFLTRVWALGLAVSMCVAMWLTQIAPSIGAEHALFGFLPPLRIATTEWGSWQTWHFQAILLLSSLAVLLSGPGRVSLDALLFRRPERRAPPEGSDQEHT